MRCLQKLGSMGMGTDYYTQELGHVLGAIHPNDTSAVNRFEVPSGTNGVMCKTSCAVSNFLPLSCIGRMRHKMGGVFCRRSYSYCRLGVEPGPVQSAGAFERLRPAADGHIGSVSVRIEGYGNGGVLLAVGFVNVVGLSAVLYAFIRG